MVCCSNKKEQNPANTDDLVNNAAVPNIEEPLINTPVSETKTLYDDDDVSLIIQEDADVYVLPSIKSRIKGNVKIDDEEKILGFAETEGAIRRQNEYWIKIYCYEQDGSRCGWIKSTVTNKENISISDLQIESSSKKTINGHTLYFLHGKNQKGELSIEAQKTENQNIYTFWWNHHCKGFHYSNRPGFYIWNEDTKELKHITYFDGINDEETTYGANMWTIVTDDYKYLIQDFGTAPPPRGIQIWNMDNGEKIFFGQYYVNINLHGHIIEVVKEYDEYFRGKWQNRKNSLTEEEIDFAQNFLKTNKPPADLVEIADSGLILALYLVLEYNMDTGKTKIKEGKYIIVQ